MSETVLVKVGDGELPDMSSRIEVALNESCGSGRMSRAPSRIAEVGRHSDHKLFISEREASLSLCVSMAISLCRLCSLNDRVNPTLASGAPTIMRSSLVANKRRDRAAGERHAGKRI